MNILETQLQSGGNERENTERRPCASTSKSIAVHVYSPTFEAFHESVGTLERAIADWALTPNEQTQGAAQAAWLRSMAIWQRAELMQVGPAGAVGRRVGGDDARDRIYSFPLTNPCRVDQELVAERYTNEIKHPSLNVRGMDALESFLWVANQTPARCRQHQSGGRVVAMVARSEDERLRRRSEMAQGLVGMVLVDAQLQDAWSEGALREVPRTEVHHMRIRRARPGLAMFYVDRMMKTRSLLQGSRWNVSQTSAPMPSNSCPDLKGELSCEPGGSEGHLPGRRR